MSRLMYESLVTQQSSAGTEEFSASLIVPVRNGVGALSAFISSYAEQRTNRPFEVIVVDNGSTDGTADVVRLSAERWPHVRLVQESRPGAGRARHAGALVAKAGILVFLDGDMRAEPVLVEEHLRSHASQPNTCVIGAIVSAPARHPFDRMLAYIYDGPRASLDQRPPSYGDCWPGNLSLPRDLYFTLGGFHDIYGGFGGEGPDLIQRMALARVPLRYAPKALAHHHFSDRFGPRLRRNYWNGVAFGYQRSRHPEAVLEGFRPVHGRRRSWLVEKACLAVATVLELFDRGTGVPAKPLAFFYDLGLRTAAGRGLADYDAGRARPLDAAVPKA